MAVPKGAIPETIEPEGYFNLKARFCCRLATDATMRTHQFNLGFQLTATTNALLWAFRSSRPRWKSSASLRVFE
jgi:hypothetical protein